MAFIKLDPEHQDVADICYENEEKLLIWLDNMEATWGKTRWSSVGRTNIELGFMALRKSITEHQADSALPQTDINGLKHKL
jgi:hypothetical protein